MKKMNNKGFSLVELIIVIAIMAVLMGVLAPQLLKYVEDSRVQTDLSAMAEVENATKIALSVEEIYNAAGDTVTVDITNGSQPSSSLDVLTEELAKTFPEPIELTSKTLKDATGTVTCTFDATAGTFTITNNFDELVGED